MLHFSFTIMQSSKSNISSLLGTGLFLEPGEKVKMTRMTAVEVGFVGKRNGVGYMEGFSKKEKKNKLMDMGKSVVIAKEKGGREGGGGYSGYK